MSDQTSKAVRYLCTIARGLWAALAVLLLVLSLWYYDGTPNSDAELLLAYGMLALSFPSGLLVGGAFFVTFKACGLVAKTSYLSIVIIWCTLSALGYWQWFKFTPWVSRRLLSY